MKDDRVRGGGDRIAEALQASGVETLYTLCGGHVAPILAAAKARGMRIIDVRDEANAVFAADAAARISGRPGVAVVTAGPGVSNTITALKNAQLAQSPLLVIGGAAPTLLQGRGALQDIDQGPMLRPQLKHYGKPRRVAELNPAISEALGRAQAGIPGPVFVECPVDLLYDEATIRRWYQEASPRGTSLAARLQRAYIRWHLHRQFSGSVRDLQGPAWSVFRPQPKAADIDRAARALRASQRPLLLIGSQALVAASHADQVAAAVERLGVPVYLSGMARGLLGRGSAVQFRHYRRQALRAADCVILAGLPCDFRLDYGSPIRKDACLIAANRSAHDARLNRRPRITAIGDAGCFLQGLAERLGDWQPDAGWTEQLRAQDQKREQEIAAQAQTKSQGPGVHPLALFAEIDRIAAADAVFVADGGDFVATAAYRLHPRAPLRWLDPGVFGTLGVGAGFILGAAAELPASERWLIWGDGAAGFSLIEIDSFVRHGIGLIAVVGNDASWTQIAREQVKMLGDDVGTVLARSDYHRVASALGGVGLMIQSPQEMPAVLAEAQAFARSGRPVLVNVWLSASDFREGSLSM